MTDTLPTARRPLRATVRAFERQPPSNARAEESRLSQLTPRERDVLREMASGKSNVAIGASLFLAERSVEKVIHSIFLKLGLTWETAVHKRVKAVILYLAESDQHQLETGSEPET